MRARPTPMVPLARPIDVLGEDRRPASPARTARTMM